MEELYKRYSKLIYRYLYSITKNSFIAEELVQETFYCAIKNSNKITDESNIKTWLYKIAYNKWIDYLRKNKLTEISYEEQVDILKSDDNIENDIIEKEEKMDLYKKIHNLDESTREVMYLRINGELSFKEIGEILGKSEEWSRVIFYRGKLKLKEDLNYEFRE